jgi:hypothetical protein
VDIIFSTDTNMLELMMGGEMTSWMKRKRRGMEGGQRKQQHKSQARKIHNHTYQLL